MFFDPKYLSLSDNLLDTIAKTPIDFTDALYILLAKKLKIPLVTHDKKMLRSYSTHYGKEKLYSLVFKPQDLL